MFESDDKLSKPRMLVILAIALSFMTGWYSKGKWVIYRAEPHYIERISEVLQLADSRQLQRDYPEAHKDHWKSAWNSDYVRLHYQLMRAHEDRCDVENIIRKAVINPDSPVPIVIQGITADQLIKSHRAALNEYELYKTIGNRVALFNDYFT